MHLLPRILSFLVGCAAASLFTDARSFNAWAPAPVPDAMMRELYALLRWAPTSTNGNHGRFVFVRSAEGKSRLLPAVAPGNVEKVRTAPVTVIVAHDLEFWRHLPVLFPHKDMAARYRDDVQAAEETAFRNGTLQGAYLMLAARTLGLDVGALSGFDRAAVDGAFFAGTSLRSNFLCNLGRGDPAGQWPRLPRLAFEDACSFA